MFESDFEKRVQINEIIENQLPEFILEESPKTVDFLKQYYISQEYQGGPVDIAENLDQYLKLDNLTPEVITGSTTLSYDISSSAGIVTVTSTKGFPAQYGLLKINDEIITYTGVTTNTFTGCVRGFSGITNYSSGISSYTDSVNNNDLVFSTSSSDSHTKNETVTNLSSLFLQEFYKKLKYFLTPGLENNDFVSDLDVSNFIKEARSFYQAKGIQESFRILFNVLYGEDARVIDLESFLIKPSTAKFIRREVIITELISGDDPTRLVGQTIKKSTDERTQAAVSEVEIITRTNKTYYKVSLFVGYDEKDLIEGTFTIPGKTKALETVSIGSSIISVDSTIGFGQTGNIISGNNKIYYTSKSVNQFFGCSGVTEQISQISDIKSDEVMYGYEGGDINKKVELRITGVLSKFTSTSDIYLADENEIISIKNIGKVIKNPSADRTYEEIFANSWIYNTSSRYQVSTVSGSTFTLLSAIDKSSLKVGDTIDILKRGSNIVVASNATVSTINLSFNQVILSNIYGFVYDPSADYDIRRNIKKATSLGAELQYGNSKFISDVLNVYVGIGSTSTENSDYGYVASNSLPSYTITQNISESVLAEANGSYLQGYSNETFRYSILSFTSNISFLSGDEIIYKPSNLTIPGLTSGERYFVKLVGTYPSNQIRLYTSRSFLSGNNYVEFDTLPNGSGSHSFVLKKDVARFVGSKNILRKFPLNQSLSVSGHVPSNTTTLGLLCNGVEIISPKSDDKIYYGPLSEFNVLNSGKDYDVINPPNITISSPSIGTTALVVPVISGIVTAVLVDPQDFDVDQILSVSLTGGNGSGCLLQPVVGERYRELEFDSRDIFFGGGIDFSDETITFTSNHNLKDGDPIIYNQNGNNPIGVGTFKGSNNFTSTSTLVSGSKYYAKVINTKTIRLHNKSADYSAGINTIGITTSNTSGIHKFRTISKKTLRSIKVLNSGEGYQFRKLYVKSSGISTYYDTFTFKNHGFNTGDLVEYSTTGTLVSGLSTSNQYYILKSDNDSFKVVDAGIGASITSNYTRGKVVNLTSTGSGYHIFKYPDINVSINVSYGSTYSGNFTLTPVISGKIIDAYLYESGTDYGSDILNLQRKPVITLKNGKGAELKPIIVDGRISSVQVMSKGSEYYSTPDIVVSGSGSGAILRPIIEQNQLIDVVVINSGIGYTSTNTSLQVNSKGSGALFDSRIRPLTLNRQFKYKTEYFSDSGNTLSYNLLGYSQDFGESVFSDNGANHSPIIGWAYDGNPIYGPYGYATPNNNASPLKILKTAYILNTNNIINRPSGFDAGFFIEDYVYDNSGDLDICNGRFTKTPEFPNGVYAYFAGVSTSVITNKLEPSYPYFIGDFYRSSLINENFILDQSFDFNNSELARNTFPYKVQDEYADNDFIIESNEVIKQLSSIESVTKGSVDSLEVLSGGDGYKIGDYTVFDDNNTNGTGIKAVVSSLVGKDILSIDTNLQRYENSVFIFDGTSSITVYQPTYNQLNDGDNVVISGLSSSILGLSGTFKVGVSTDKIKLFKEIPSNIIPTGDVEDIYVSQIPNSISIGSSLSVEGEILKVLNTYSEGSILRVKRFGVGSAHTLGTSVNILSNRFSINTKTPQFDSTLNNKVYFNGQQSVGLGTTSGLGTEVTYTIGETSKQISIPTQSIYLPNHPFKNGERLTLSKNPSADSFIVGNGPSGSTYFLPDNFTATSTVYVITKSKDYIGLTTVVGLTTNTNGLYFYSNGSNDYEYLLQTNFNQVTGNVDRIVSSIRTSEPHGLQNGDTIKLEVTPNTSVGIGTSTSIKVKYNSDFAKLIINPVGFTSSQINNVTDKITLTSHKFKTGDKVLYSSTDQIASGLNTGIYYIYKIDSNTIQLAETYYDTQLDSPNIINIIGIGGSQHSLGLVNPPIEVIRKSNLVFDLSDSSLINSKFKVFYDKDFNNEFLSTKENSSFNIAGLGTVGVAQTSSLTLNYSDGLPSKLYYNLERSGYISTSDSDVKDFSEIIFKNSAYNGTYNVFGIGSTTFSISLTNVPESYSYTPLDCDKIEYSASSENIVGSVKSLRLLSKGFNYKKLPKFVRIESDNGDNANILPLSNSIGRIKNVRILDIGYEYSSDKTLRPEAFISPVITLEKSDTIQEVNVLYGGRNYLNPPNLIVFDPISNTVVDSSSLSCEVPNSTIFKVNILGPIYGLESTNQRIIAINNSNGVGISSIVTSTSGIVTCILSTPLNGFTRQPFVVGDEIFVEGIEKYTTDGTGFNSSDYNYQFFNISLYENTNPAKLEFNISGLTTNPGLAKTYQSGYATIINKNVYPIFENIQTRSLFELGEQLYSDIGSGFVERDVYITDSRRDYIKIKGTYNPSKGERIKGRKSGVIASIKDISSNSGKFEIDYSSRQDYGWNDNIGKLNEDYQVTTDNDYYQNLSYTIKSSIEYDKFIDPVNRLLHPAGLKNFADTSIESTVNGSVSYASTTNDVVILDISEEKRVDNINNFDFGLDYDIRQDKSKYLKFRNRRLTDYTKCKTNRVLIIDDISSRFSSKGFQDLFTDICTIDDNFEKYLVQIINPDNFETQLTELIVLSTESDVLTLEKGSIYSKNRLGDLQAQIDTFDRKTLRFTPDELYNSDHDIKVLKLNFNTDLAGIGTQSIGSISLTGSNKIVSSGTTSTIVSYSLPNFESIFANIQIFNTITREINYLEVLLDYDGTNTYISEYYFDSGSESSSQKYVGILTATANLVTNRISLDFTNDQTTPLLIRSNVVGFGSTVSGIGTYRFRIPGQIDELERSARLESTYSVGISTRTVCNLKYDLDSGLKSLVKVSCGKTSALHQVMLINDKSDSYILQYPFVSTGSTSGIGTFGSERSGNVLSLKFYPDPIFNSTVEVQSYNEILYTENDFINENPPLLYGSSTQSLFLSAYDGINGNRANKTDFDLKFNGSPIYFKTFDPTNSLQLEASTGIFTIPNHFFNTGEEISYTPESSYVDISASAVGIGSTANYLGIVTNRLPQFVYPIVLNSNQFKLATKQEYANTGIFVTFTSYGSGNAHKLEMGKKLEKSIISLDGIVQQPITYTPIRHTLTNNNGQISAASSVFSLSGISSLQPRDVLRIDNEYMKVISVGFGSTAVGPITGLGTFSLVKVIRGSVGSSVTSHTDGTVSQIYRGSFNIVGSKVYFLDPPKGNTRSRRDISNLPYTKAEFSGRVFLRKNYSTNILFDDISDQFTGIGKTYTLSVQGVNTTGITIGNGILFINGVFQTPTTENNAGNNYTLTENAGISSVVFSGISSENGQFIQSEFDINQNQLPRGGLIVSLGSTPGLGYAPLVGSSVTAVINPATGSIVSVGLGSTDVLGSGYRGVVSIGVTQYGGFIGSAATIIATVGAGGTLSFNVSYGGTGYTNPVFQIPQPSYENLEIVGVSRLGIGTTTDTGKNLLITVDIGSSKTTGIGSTLFQVSSFSIARSGHSFKVGDVFKPVGLVTAKGLSSPVNDFQLTVVETFNDYFSAWQFGEMDYIDSVRFLQDGARQRFPLYYNGQLLSFEVDPADSVSSEIDLNAVLIIFINGVLQVPGTSYQFEGGTSFTFTQPPKENDKIDIFFYLGTSGVDIEIIDVNESIKFGDNLSVYKNPNYPDTISQENSRVILDIIGSDLVETDVYVGRGVDENNYKPIEWEKQKVDRVIKGDYIFKVRDSIESQIYPTAKIITDLNSSSSEIFVDNAEFFNYEENNYGITINTFDSLIVAGNDPVAAAMSATVSVGGTIQSITITNPGYGYSTSPVTVKISNPKKIGIGIGTTATASATIVNGGVTSVNITNPGFGYTIAPQVIIETPKYSHELVTDITFVQGFSGIITGITTSVGTGGHPLALKFFFRANAATASDLIANYPVLIVDTKVGSGVTSVGTSDSSIVGIGTSFLDNIYNVSSISNLGPNAVMVCNVRTSSNVIGINTSGSLTNPLGRISWGRLYGLNRSSSPVSIGVTGLIVDAGLSTFPSIQRRKFGLRNSGAIRKISNTV